MSRPAVTSDDWQLVVCAFRRDPAVTYEQFVDALEKCVAAATREGAATLAAAEARAEKAEAERDRAQERIRAWTDGCEPPPLEDHDALGPPDIAELIQAAPSFTGDRKGDPVDVRLEIYEAVVSRSEIVAYGRALAWQQEEIRRLRDALDAAEARAEKSEALDTFTRCCCCDNYAEETLESDGDYQCLSCTRLANTEAERDRLREALERLEWDEESFQDSRDPNIEQVLRVCYWCGANLWDGVPSHHADCIIGRALNRPECQGGG